MILVHAIHQAQAGHDVERIRYRTSEYTPNMQTAVHLPASLVPMRRVSLCPISRGTSQPTELSLAFGSGLVAGRGHFVCGRRAVMYQLAEHVKMHRDRYEAQ